MEPRLLPTTQPKFNPFRYHELIIRSFSGERAENNDILRTDVIGVLSPSHMSKHLFLARNFRIGNQRMELNLTDIIVVLSPTGENEFRSVREVPASW